MELLLNLAWMLLALPAYWLWRRNAEDTRGCGLKPLQCLLALGCVLVLLFPVISATDDLHAMRAEMEDSATSKRAVRQAGGEKNSAWVNRLQAPPAAVATGRCGTSTPRWTSLCASATPCVRNAAASTLSRSRARNRTG